MTGHNSQATIENPFVKRRNKSWELTAPDSLNRGVSPPPRARPKHRIDTTASPRRFVPTKSATAAVEAGEVEVEDPVSFFSTKLLNARLPDSVNRPRLAHQAWLDLYQRNLNDRGHHFVIHQHDHPIAGTHYDLRLQCNASSSISFAIMYGLPGDPNSVRQNRNATETRVHNVWNHLIETASSDTGTMLLWDTGEFFVLPYRSSRSSSSNTLMDSSTSDSDVGDIREESEPQKLHQAFQARKIKLRLHGTKLPPNYTITLRLTAENNRLEQPAPPSFRRRRRHNSAMARKQDAETSESSQSSSRESRDGRTTENRSPRGPHLKQSVSSLHRLASPPARKRSAGEIDYDMYKKKRQKEDSAIAILAASSDPNPAQAPSADERIRLQNAYPGANNSINSIHQRKWFLSLDRHACGFTPAKDPKTGQKIWRCRRRQRGDADAGADEEDAVFKKFHVLGRDHETSVLTGRKAADIARDEGLIGYRPRGGWRGITE
ncbi:uncharacterized protein A1O9_10223 [Exophiala aquamarina CBS 119918]|uniref:DNA ligase D 3'-phosphoesterase domain-containing protein n=1 Tax=Exophiala aquamarina CBS 119918 TaxID=1182545 RepID=A0A072P2B6_9EURO|nr:uncharacterized protein A1O9_10223 [Exophiala aquamarina CBS 119918]KEF53822.1 hypothetical protein A1O9_10223 [Exophiala aquamarina CBS 119918]